MFTALKFLTVWKIHTDWLALLSSIINGYKKTFAIRLLLMWFWLYNTLIVTQSKQRLWALTCNSVVMEKKTNPQFVLVWSVKACSVSVGIRFGSVLYIKVHHLGTADQRLANFLYTWKFHHKLIDHGTRNHLRVATVIHTKQRQGRHKLFICPVCLHLHILPVYPICSAAAKSLMKWLFYYSSEGGGHTVHVSENCSAT